MEYDGECFDMPEDSEEDRPAYEDLIRFRREVMLAWGRGVVSGFDGFKDDIEDCLTVEEQDEAINMAEKERGI